MKADADSIIDCLGNPLKARIVIMMKECGPLTPKQIMERDPGMPQASVYRALKSMEDCHVIRVVAETKIKAMVEKTYSVSDELQGKLRDVISTNDGDAYFRLFAAFAFDLMRSFENYTKGDGIDIKRDGSGFFGMSIFATTDELDDLYSKIYEVVRPYMDRRSDDQHPHTLGFVATPPRETI